MLTMTRKQKSQQSQEKDSVAPTPTAAIRKLPRKSAHRDKPKEAPTAPSKRTKSRRTRAHSKKIRAPSPASSDTATLAPRDESIPKESMISTSSINDKLQPGEMLLGSYVQWNEFQTILSPDGQVRTRFFLQKHFPVSQGLDCMFDDMSMGNNTPNSFMDIPRTQSYDVDGPIDPHNGTVNPKDLQINVDNVPATNMESGGVDLRDWLVPSALDPEENAPAVGNLSNNMEELPAY